MRILGRLPWGSLATAAVSTLLGLALLDLAVARLPRKEATVYPPAALSFQAPFNTRRCRDFEYPAEKPPDCFRIVAVGDSFTYGGGLSFDDSWPKRLERHLNWFGRRGDGNYQVLNQGMPGTSTPKQLGVVRRALEELKPDLIILAYCLNDAEDWGDPIGLMRMRGRYHMNGFEKPGGWRGLLHEHSALLRLVAGRIYNTLTFRGQKSYYRALYEEGYAGWNETRRALLDLGELSRQSKVPVAVMIFPLFSFGLGEAYPFAAVHAKIGAALDEAGLPYLDLRETYRGMDAVRLEAVPYRDPHPSEIAQRMAAESLLRWLPREGFLPGSRAIRNLERWKEAPASPF